MSDAKRNIQTIIKEAAERYSLEYDENKKVHTIETEEGTVKEITRNDFLKAFNVLQPERKR